MSAFIVSPKTMTEIITGLRCISQDVIELDGKPYIITDKSLSEIGRLLYTLNRVAIKERYGAAALPDMDPGSLHQNYIYELNATRVTSREQALKSMNCLLYQCAEGDLPNSPLYKALKLKAGELAQLIVMDTKSYQQASWD